MSLLSVFFNFLGTASRREESKTYLCPHTGLTYHYGKCYDAAGNMLEETVDSSPFIGEIMLFAGNFVPLFFNACDGSLLSIAEESALFALIGTTYGGDGVTTFGLPDLRGRVPISSGTGPGLSDATLGSSFGSATTTLGATNLPNSIGLTADLVKPRATGTAATGFVTGRVDGTKSIAVAAGGQSYPNMPPYLGLQYCIAIAGIFPSRN